ncbi:RrF2 family transcriptional regulator [Lutibacter maritimus]|uniref:Transcriptional regulator, BadM/Rrf2 family n=1 Tax=Lutibacter maritimus TaxID=593133 RepID=A0A1I6QHY7_9FLAO|nr:Rrf2 family transcriptional regulator [Lutibacter maritimus]SFS52071.1 transcriptional regulator, BadM/Rrf2 family [Lutibacter maritimus]
MMLSRASKYAILSTLFLAEHSSETHKISVKVIAESIDVPNPFLAKLFQQLVRGKIISSTKGPNGGFYLTKKNGKRTVLDIIENIDGLTRLNECFLGLSECDGANPCPVHFIVEPFKNGILGKFRDLTIMEFSKEITSQGRKLTLKDITPEFK